MSVKKIVRISLISRLIVFFLQVTFNFLIKDHNADAFKGINFENNDDTVLSNFLYDSLDGLNKWDSRYFLSISEYGYNNIEWIAFFPFYPFLIRITSNFYKTFLPLNYPTTNFLAAFTINNVAFLISCIILHKLTINLFNDKIFAINTVKWFSYNPASIFFSATYTESLYFALFITGIWLIYEPFNYNNHLNNLNNIKNLFTEYNQVNYFLRRNSKENLNLVFAIICFVCASFTRSNGITNVGYFWYLFMLDFCCIILFKKKYNTSWFFKILSLISIISITLFIVSPFFYVQHVHKNNFCSVFKNEKYCLINFWNLYSYVQKEFWNVGLFNYYQIKKLPNFLLATPMYFLISVIIKNYIKFSKSNLIKNESDEYWNKTILLLPFILQLIFLSIFSIFYINIEVITRLICSSSPIIFWSICKLPRRIQNFVKVYFFMYFVVGCLAFSNFLPWT